MVSTLAKDWSNPLLGGSRTNIGADDTRDPALDNSVFSLRGFSGANSSTCQDVQIDGKKGETFTIGAWAKGENTVPTTGKDGCFFGVQVEVKQNDGNYKTIETVDFYDGIQGWQYLGNTFSLEEDTPVIRIRLCYFKQLGSAYFDGIQLYKEDWLTAAPNIEGNENKIECPCSKCIEPGCDCKCIAEKDCTCSQCKRFTEVYSNDNGQTTEQYITDGVKKYKTINTYSNSNNYIESYRNSGQDELKYKYDEKTGKLLSQEGVYYAYNTSGKMSQLSQEIGNGQIRSNQYKYYGNAIKTITHNGFDYHLKHNAFGDLTEMSIGNQKYITNTYTNNSPKKLQNVEFGNKQKLAYQYDNQGNILGISQSGGVDWRFKFTYGANGQKTITDQRTQICTEYENDGVTVYHQPTQSVLYRSGMDDKGNTLEQVSGNAQFTYEEKDENRNDKTGKTKNGYVLSGNPVRLDFGSTTDYFGRQEQKTLTYSNKGMPKYTQSINYKYRDVGTDETTKQIASYEQNHLSVGLSTVFSKYDYTYDGTGNIKTVSKNGTLVRSYNYDKTGCMTQEIDHVTSTVYSYTYDAGGNLVHRSSGPYDPNHITWIQQDKTFTYGDMNWKDKLTEYNGKVITYDEIGNPLTYDGWTYTWEAGRQLKSQSKDDLKIEYEYDYQGLRTHKKVTRNGKTETFDYVWKDGKLLGLTRKSNTMEDCLYFFYHEDGKAAGYVYNNTDVYFYQSDAQGNVNAVVKQDGSIAAQYEYDAWGNMLKATGNNMVELNPLTYRGYMFDCESGYYYLQSRYYNPEWGRFLNADSVLNTKNLYDINMYLYCSNNPVAFTDPEGKYTAGEAASIGFMFGMFLLVIRESFSTMGVKPEKFENSFVNLYKGNAIFSNAMLDLAISLGIKGFNSISSYIDNFLDEIFYYFIPLSVNKDDGFFEFGSKTYTKKGAAAKNRVVAYALDFVLAASSAAAGVALAGTVVGALPGALIVTLGVIRAIIMLVNIFFATMYIQSSGGFKYISFKAIYGVYFIDFVVGGL